MTGYQDSSSSYGHQVICPIGWELQSGNLYSVMLQSTHTFHQQEQKKQQYHKSLPNALDFLLMD